MMGVPANGAMFMRNTPNSATPRNTSMISTRSRGATGTMPASKLDECTTELLLLLVQRKARLHRRCIPGEPFCGSNRARLQMLCGVVFFQCRLRGSTDFDRGGVVFKQVTHLREQLQSSRRITMRRVGPGSERGGQQELSLDMICPRGALQPCQALVTRRRVTLRA